jgi:hypothetical protein
VVSALLLRAMGAAPAWVDGSIIERSAQHLQEKKDLQEVLQIKNDHRIRIVRTVRVVR